MTTLADDLVPDELWALAAPLLKFVPENQDLGSEADAAVETN
jgi:hypothetical protein